MKKDKEKSRFGSKGYSGSGGGIRGRKRSTGIFLTLQKKKKSSFEIMEFLG